MLEFALKGVTIIEAIFDALVLYLFLLGVFSLGVFTIGSAMDLGLTTKAIVSTSGIAAFIVEIGVGFYIFFPKNGD